MTTKMTASKRKLAAWADTRELDARAKELAEREGITFVEALARAAKEEATCTSASKATTN